MRSSTGSSARLGTPSSRVGAWVEPRLEEGDISRDPAEGKAWGEERTVRAGLLYALLTTEALPSGRRPRALRLRQVRIRDQLDLEGASVACPLWSEDCFVEDAILLRDGLAAALSFRGCHLPGGLSAQRLETRGDLDLTRVVAEGELAEGALIMYDAHIAGQVFLDGARLGKLGGRALYADGLTVEAYMLCREGFSATGEVRLPGAHIGGQLDFSGARLLGLGGAALNADNITVDGDLVCREGFEASAEVRLLGAQIGGQLDFSGATLRNLEGYALLAARLTVEGDTFCRDGFAATGAVNLHGARIGGQLTLRGASYLTALDLEGLTARELILQPAAPPVGQRRLDKRGDRTRC
jgi:hypothetical protein